MQVNVCVCVGYEMTNYDIVTMKQNTTKLFDAPVFAALQFSYTK